MLSKRLKAILAKIPDEAKVNISYHNNGKTCVILAENKADKSLGKKIIVVYVAE